MSQIKIPKLDATVHSPVRLGILSILISVQETDFIHLKKATDTTDGNLSTHLTKLEQKGMIQVKKSFKGKKPQTTCKITKKGRSAFLTYIKNLETFIKISKK